MIKILFVCHGNICRSPMAEFLMKDFVEKKGESEKFYIASGATSSEELGNPVHYGTRAILNKLNINCDGKYAYQINKSDYDKYDYIIAMESYNIRNMMRIFNEDKDNKIFRLMDFTSCPKDVADPYYYGNFDVVYADILSGIEALYKYLKEKNA